jgi:hypothetical protein
MNTVPQPQLVNTTTGTQYPHCPVDLIIDHLSYQTRVLMTISFQVPHLIRRLWDHSREFDRARCAVSLADHISKDTDHDVVRLLGWDEPKNHRHADLDITFSFISHIRDMCACYLGSISRPTGTYCPCLLYMNKSIYMSITLPLFWACEYMCICMCTTYTLSHTYTHM